MCLSDAYETSEGTDRLILNRVINVTVNDRYIVLRNLLGMEIVLEGRISSIDLNSNIIRIDTGKENRNYAAPSG